MAPAPSKPAIAAAPSVKIDSFGSTFLTPSTATTAPAIFSASSKNPMMLLLFEWLNVLYRLRKTGCFDGYALQPAGQRYHGEGLMLVLLYNAEKIPVGI